MVKIPPYLLPGDTIGIVCPAGYISSEKVQSAIQTFQDWGYQVKIGKTLGTDTENYFSGSDKDRLADFQEILDDDLVKAVFCARGGYGTGRIIEEISFK